MIAEHKRQGVIHLMLGAMHPLEVITPNDWVFNTPPPGGGPLPSLGVACHA
jgi:hypothetical protein